MELMGTRVTRESPSTTVNEVVPRRSEGTSQSVGVPVMAIQWCNAIQIAPYSLDAEANLRSNASYPTHHPASQRRHKNGPETTILVVEDDPDISMALQDLLEFEGFTVECVGTCHQAFSSIEQRTYDAVLLDLGLPDGDGRSVLERLYISRPTIPVIVLSATNRDLGLLHPYARLTKPWDREELCTILYRAIGTASKKA